MPVVNKAHPWYNTTWRVEERVDSLVKAMTLREQIAQMLHWAPPIPCGRHRLCADKEACRSQKLSPTVS